MSRPRHDDQESNRLKKQYKNMAEFNLDNILRKNVKKLIPYSSARSEFEGDAQIFLDANENSLGSSIDVNLIAILIRCKNN